MILSDKKKCHFSYTANNESCNKCKVPSGNNSRSSPPKLSAKETGKIALWQIKKVLNSHFPDLSSRLNAMEDNRERERYTVEELVLGGLMLFLLKQKSRNSMDNLRRQEDFSKNYYRAFKRRCPSMDAVEDFYRILEPKELEDLKAQLIARLIDKRVFHRFRLMGKYFVVAVDATGVHSSSRLYWKECTKKESCSGKITCMSNVLEAKLICSNGLSLSICSEWIVNPVDEVYDKQDCEQKAFKRLSVRLKEYFPRLPLCLVFDGLYCNGPVMDICQDNDWNWIAVFKDGSLPSVHLELDLLPDGAFSRQCRLMPHRKMEEKYTWCNQLDYGNRKIHWLECLENKKKKDGSYEKHHFQYLTNILQDGETAVACVYYARKRWNIEESFNDQKNRDFAMQHLFSRHSFTSFANWYQTLQLAYNIYMFVVKSVEMVELVKSSGKLTICAIWSDLVGMLKFIDITDIITEFDHWIASPRQVRLC